MDQSINSGSQAQQKQDRKNGKIRKKRKYIYNLFFTTVVLIVLSSKIMQNQHNFNDIGQKIQIGNLIFPLL